MTELYLHPDADLGDAGMCRKHGWKVGDIIEGTERGSTWSTCTRIKILYIGRHSILAKTVWENGEDQDGDEGSWSLRYRDWKLFEAAPPAPTSAIEAWQSAVTWLDSHAHEDSQTLAYEMVHEGERIFGEYAYRDQEQVKKGAKGAADDPG